MTLSVIICTHRGPASMDKLLQSLADQTWPEGDQILVVDNGMAAERSVELSSLASALRLPFVFIREPRPGLGFARVAGVKKATSDWIIFLDDDNSCDPGSLDVFRRFAGQHPEVGGICPEIHAVWEKPVPDMIDRLGVRLFSVTRSGKYGHNGQPAIWPASLPPPIRPPGGGMIIRRGAADLFLDLCTQQPRFLGLDRTGGRLIGSQDELILQQVRRAGFSSAYEPSIVFRHHLPHARSQWPYLRRLSFWGFYSYAYLERLQAARTGILFTLRKLARATRNMCREISAGHQPKRLVLFNWLGYCWGLLDQIKDPIP